MVFPTTHWSTLARASLNGDTAGRQALEELCRRYWAPLNQFIRWRGHTDAEAEDLTQEFLLHVLDHSTFQRADRLRGKFRSLLLGALIRFLSDERDRRNAQKRGGQLVHVSLDADDSNTVRSEAAETAQEAALFDRSWALTILKSAWEGVRQEYTEAGCGDAFSALKHFLPGAAEQPTYEQVAEELGVSVSALNSEVHRLRSRFRENVRAHVAGTVSAPHEIDEEMAHLHRVLLDRGTDLGPIRES